MEDPTISAIRRILSQNPKKTLVEPSLVPAGVMLLLYPHDGEYCILLNRRTELVEDHKGEISFPGGRKEEGDRTLLDTALRETREEMGIRPEDVEVLGELDDVATSTNYLISTFVGTIPCRYRFRPQEQEVAEVLEIPVSVLGDAASLRDEVHIVGECLVNNPSYAYRGHLIHGVTARLLRRFHEILHSAPDVEA